LCFLDNDSALMFIRTHPQRQPRELRFFFQYEEVSEWVVLGRAPGGENLETGPPGAHGTFRHLFKVLSAPVAVAKLLTAISTPLLPSTSILEGLSLYSYRALSAGVRRFALKLGGELPYVDCTAARVTLAARLRWINDTPIGHVSRSQ
jgi:hypothetical protein